MNLNAAKIAKVYYAGNQFNLMEKTHAKKTITINASHYICPQRLC